MKEIKFSQYTDDTALILDSRIPNGLSDTKLNDNKQKPFRDGVNCGNDGKSISNLHGLNIKSKR